MNPFLPSEAFGPTPDAQRPVDVTTTPTTLNLSSATRLGQNLRIMVSGTQEIAWAYGAGVAGLTMDNGVPMVGNTVEVFGAPEGTTAITVVAGANGSKVRVSVGEGN